MQYVVASQLVVGDRVGLSEDSQEATHEVVSVRPERAIDIVLVLSLTSGEHARLECQPDEMVLRVR